MEKEFIPYEQALKLKELGFDEECFGIYGKNGEELYKVVKDKFDSIDDLHFIKAPLYQQAFRWFREKYGYDVTIKKCTPSEYKFEIEQLFVKGDSYYFIDFPFTSYEEAELECLKKLIELCKNN